MEDKNVPAESYKSKRGLHSVPEPILTEGDLQMKQLVQRQLKTDVTLQGQLSKVKQFTLGTVYCTPTDKVAGLINPSEFNRLVEDGRHLEELRQFGLSEEEIALKLQFDSVANAQSKYMKAHYGVDPSAHAERLTLIEKKIEDKEKLLLQPTTFSGAKPLTRHEMDLEHAIARDRNSSKLFRCLLTEKSLDDVDPDHPINHLDSILDDILPSSSKSKRERRKRKRKADQESEIEKIEIGCSPAPVLDTEPNNVCYLNNAWLPVHSDHVPECEGKISHPKPEKIDYDNVEPIPVEVIERYKLSESQIKELPRFGNYDPGLPSQTLYLKNLSPRVSEQDLVSLFIRFQVKYSRPLVFKLLGGKMKGQAFVTFDSAETATKALNLVNGYDFKGKPIIIEFGKKAEDSTIPLKISDISTMQKSEENCRPTYCVVAQSKVQNELIMNLK